ncbi:threonine-phosphate decarboxylase [Dyella monticola]|uniref:threonine-phosphate decarboxylase n=1 Tax=Dyella monticola TaxID=1927958 RepID=A0A370X875_9GAMM|nr:threonine-phosphate decarboxylase CobD [Dyella monticola]RDS84477.1 threonine-phosphate decarboxylase [Dyella monticola]
MLEHGGRLQRAAQEYGIASAQWLDLSTGISPFGWPVPDVPPPIWQRLPEDEDGLNDAACAYYEAAHVLPVAGSQAAIQALPWLRPTARVGIIAPGYAEHAHAWRRAGHQVTCLPADILLADVTAWDVLVLIHPNNPGGERFDPQALLRAHAELAARGGWLVIDEAFMDLTPADSLCRYALREGLIVLRSAGKFFGLAGARAGFVCASPQRLGELREALGPWALSGPTRYVLQQALADRLWQAQARARLAHAGERLAGVLSRHGLQPTAGCGLFHWCRRDDAAAIHRALAMRGILTRLFDTPPSLRFGLPADDAAFDRLNAALSEVMR